MTGVTHWDPFRDLFMFQNEFNRFLNNSLQMSNGTGQYSNGQNGNGQNGSSYWIPPLDVWETEDEYVVAASLPGIEPDNVNITLANHVLTIQGQVQPSQPQGQLRLRERQYGNFYRTIQLPATVDNNQIEANYYNGVLTLRLPKAEEAKPKRIPVYSNGRAISANGQHNNQRVIEAQAS